MANPLSNGYREPQKDSNFLKFRDEGVYLIRILTPKTDVLSYYTCFTNENKKIILPDKGDGIIPLKPLEAKENPKLVWTVAVWNVDEQKVQVWEIAQSSIRKFLFDIASGKIKNDWTKFDLQITKKGQNLETVYTIMTGDTRELTQSEIDEISKVHIDLSAMEKGEDPFLKTTAPF